MMKHNLFLRILGSLLFVGMLLIGVASPGAAAPSNREKAILVVSYGYSQPEVITKDIESVERAIQEAFPDYDVFRAFSSQDAVNELMNQHGIKVDTVKEAIERLQAAGYTEVVLQPLYITEDEDYRQIQEMVEYYKGEKFFDRLTLGRPLLPDLEQQDCTDDYLGFLFAVKGEFTMLQCCNGLVLVGHGEKNQGNDAFISLQKKIDAAGFGNIYTCALDGYPSFDNVLAKLHARRLKKITLVPCTLAITDQSSAHDVSFQELEAAYNNLKSYGSTVEIYKHGLGESFNIQQLFVQHLKENIDRVGANSNALEVPPKEDSHLTLQQISIREAFSMWERKKAAFIDVRTPEEFRQGHIPGARLIPLAELASRIQEVPKDKKVLLICRSGKRSAEANLFLQKHGFTNTYSVADGMFAWSGTMER